jgi:L-threonylcarbamoyladenylate synthase
VITTDIAKAIEALRREEVIAIPTETVYGLAGNAFSEKALKKIYELKNRPRFNPLIVHVKDAGMLPAIVREIPPVAEKLAAVFWPGPLTLVLKKQPAISDIITAGLDTVAVRVPNHPLTLALLRSIDFPLAAPSANPFGAVSPTTAQHVYQYFDDKIEVILDGGECQRGVESTILGFENDQPLLLRHGAIMIEEIEKVAGKIKIAVQRQGSSPQAPGMLPRHYAPAIPTFLTDDVPSLIKKFEGKKIGLLLFSRRMPAASNLTQEILSPQGDLNEAAHNLYAALLRLEQCHPDVIIAERVPDQGLGRTINDRLKRASTELNNCYVYPGI